MNRAEIGIDTSSHHWLSPTGNAVVQKAAFLTTARELAGVYFETRRISTGGD
jgi:hypothetical protein